MVLLITPTAVLVEVLGKDVRLSIRSMVHILKKITVQRNRHRQVWRQQMTMWINNIETLAECVEYDI